MNPITPVSQAEKEKLKILPELGTSVRPINPDIELKPYTQKNVVDVDPQLLGKNKIDSAKLLEGQTQVSIEKGEQQFIGGTTDQGAARASQIASAVSTNNSSNSSNNTPQTEKQVLFSGIIARIIGNKPTPQEINDMDRLAKKDPKDGGFWLGILLQSIVERVEKIVASS